MQNNDKAILYSMLEREISNALRSLPPIFSMFEGTITTAVIQWIDPYVSAFVKPNKEIDAEELSTFVSEEAINRINNFKEKYRKEKEDNNEK